MALNLEELETAAQAALPADVYAYYAGAAWDGRTLRENREAFARVPIHYRVLRDVGTRSTATTVLGCGMTAPIIAAPTAFHRLAHPEGEVATARGVGAAGGLMTLSSLSTCDLTDVAAAATGPLWFQLYVQRDRGFTRALVQRAAAAGYRALVLTVDAPLWGVREGDIRNGFHLPPGLAPVNLLPADPEGEARGHRGAGLGEIMAWMLDASLTWRDLEWLVAESPVPVLVKGVCRPEDAREAMRCGAAGVVVSNHGGRQLDGAPATIAVLPRIAEAIAGEGPVLLDGGVRRGVDVLRALALGAAAVQVGRPVLWGLATGGAEGVQAALEMLRRELDLAMALAGCATLADITADLVG